MPSFTAARHNYALVLHRLGRSVEALRELDTLLAEQPNNPAYRTLKAAALARVGDYEGAAAIYEKLSADTGNAKQWMSYGHTLKTLGRNDRMLAAYRKAVELMPGLGEAWWSLANLKTFRFEPADMAAMHEQLRRPDLAPGDRAGFQFALGKAYEDAGDYERSWEQYAKANAAMRIHSTYNPEAHTAAVKEAEHRVRRTVADIGCDDHVRPTPARHEGQVANAVQPVEAVRDGGHGGRVAVDPQLQHVARMFCERSDGPAKP
jgi:predicted Zn-dependent protease